jgi:hypothetical protein
VIGGNFVAMVDHRRDRSGFSRTGGAHHEDEPALHHDEVFEHFGQAELVELRHVGGDVTQHHRRKTALVEHVDAEPPQPGLGDREVDFELALEAFELVRRHEPVGRLPYGLWRQNLLVDRQDGAFDLDLDGRIRREEQVGRLAFDHELEQRLGLENHGRRTICRVLVLNGFLELLVHS